MLVSKRDILKGEELTVNYNYPFASAPLWYKRILKQYIEENHLKWNSDINLHLSSNAINVMNWNETSEFVSLYLSKSKNLKYQIGSNKNRH